MRKIITITALFLLSCAPAGAKDTSWFKGHFDAVTNTCYARVYSGAHLAKHPRQRTTYIALEHFPFIYGLYGEDDVIHPSTKPEENILVIKARFRGGKKTYSETVFCRTQGDHLSCGIECDGGGFEIHSRGKDKILIRTGKSGFRVSSCGGDGEDREITRKTDDRAFLLHRLADSDCIPPKK